MSFPSLGDAHLAPYKLPRGMSNTVSALELRHIDQEQIELEEAMAESKAFSAMEFCESRTV